MRLITSVYALFLYYYFIVQVFGLDLVSRLYLYKYIPLLQQVS
jgi:hypothetical protein